MDTRGTPSKPNLLTKLMVCVDSVQYSDCAGTLHGLSLTDPAPFHSAGELLLTIDRLLDQAGYPQSTYRDRSFFRTEETEEPVEEPAFHNHWDELSRLRGKVATFALQIRFRQNATWQGVVRWMERESELAFRSALELLWILDTAFQETGGQASAQ